MNLLGSGIVAIVVGFAASMLGGALGGVAVGGKAIGNELAALMGAFYGPLAGVAGVFVGVVIVAIAH
jgi:hypothetical protein